MGRRRRSSSRSGPSRSDAARVSARILFRAPRGERTLPRVNAARAARALRCTFRTVEHLHHSESMMSRSGAGIPTATRVARVEGEAAPSAHWSKRESDVPTRGRGHYGGTTQRESASRCVPVRACALPNNISTTSVPLLFFRPIHASRTFPSVSVSRSLSLSLPPRLFLHTHTHTDLRAPPSSSRSLPRSVASRRGLRGHPPPPRSTPTVLTKAREEKNHAAEQHVCCTRADRQARWFTVNRSLSSAERAAAPIARRKVGWPRSWH